MIEIIEGDRQPALCPHCEKELRQPLTKQVESTLGVRYRYCCGKCRKALGVSHRKGFWMG